MRPVTKIFIACLFVIVDHTRVVLRNGDAQVPGSDYINANYIRQNADENGECTGKIFLVLFLLRK